MNHHVISRPGAEIHYFTENDSGKPVFLVNGYSRTHSDFKAMAKFLGDQGFRVITMDNRGSGSSEARMPFSMSDVAEDIAAILDELDLQSASLVGISMGGIVIQKFAELFPQRSEKMILISTTSSPASIRKESHGWPEGEEAIFAKMALYFSDEFVTKNKLLIKAMVKNIMTSIHEGNFLKQSDLQSRAIASCVFTDKRLTVPSLIIHGDLDQIIAVGEVNALLSRFENAKKLIYPDAGHLLIAEKGKTLYQDIASFLQ